jgi:hypothetical protein
MPSSPRSAPTTPLRGGAETRRPKERGLDAPAFAVGPPNGNGVTRLRMRGDFCVHSAELLLHFLRIFWGCVSGHRSASAQETRVAEAVSRYDAV